MKTVKGEIPIESFYTAGIAGEVFFSALKQGKFVASRCEKCNLTWFPARLFCERCMNKSEKNISLSEVGTIVSFTESCIDLDSRRLAKPITIGLINIQGTDTTFVHKLNIVKPVIGMKVKAVFEQERKGSILDIKHFVMA